VTERDEAQDFKRRARRRLIGAIALVLFLVIVPPWIMEREPKPAVSGLSVEIPSQDAKRAPARPAPPAKPEDKPARAPDRISKADEPPAGPVAAPPEARTTEEAKPRTPGPDRVEKPAEKTERTEKPRPADAAPKPAPKDTAARDSAKKAEAERAEALLAGAPAASYVVPVGTFANGDGVRQVQAKLAGAAVKSYTEAVGNGQTRVRAGPFTSREAAEKAREKVAGLGFRPGAVIVRKTGG
jgi:DedD protein